MILRLFSLFVAFTFAAHAAGKRQFRTLYYGKPSGAPESLTLTYGGNAVSVPLPQANLSAAQSLPAGALEVMFSSQPIPPKTEIPANIPKTEIPDSWTDILFLFTPDPANTTAPVRVTALDLGSEKFKPGQLLFFNRSQASVAGRVGKQTLKLGPMKSGYVEIPADGDSDYPVSIDMMLPGEKEQKTLCRSTWRQTKEDKMLVFVIPDPVRKSLSIASVPIHPLPPDKAQ
jgi:hypothetical protein